MPPAVQPAQGSRAALITSLIVAIILAVSMTVVAFYGYQKWGEAEHALQAQIDRDRLYLVETDITDPRVQALTAAKEQPAFNGLPSLLQVSIAESEALAKSIGGNATPENGAGVARNAVTDASKRIDELSGRKLVSFSVPKEATLVSALASVTDQVGQLATARQDLATQLAAAQASNQQIIAAQKAQLDEKDKLIQEANAKAEASATEAKQYQQQAADAQAALQASANNDIKKMQDANAALASQLQTRDKTILAQTKLIAGYKTKLHNVRTNATEAIAQHPDGNIIRVTDYHTVFINLGQRQHVTKGLTFEVYDKNRAIPPLGDGTSDSGLPAGKASIEVFNVGPDTSECRIVKVQPGQEIVIGDLIANLVYDPSVPYNFVVYGDFDLSNNGVPTPTDAEVVKRLITQWGGKIDQTVTTDTDFVVMGAEPVVHPVTDPNEPTQQVKHQKEVDAQAKYAAVIAAASQLGVPILNQNRFLYLIGYYDQASR